MSSNQRLVCLPSQGLGEDWVELSTSIDEMIPGYGLDLSEEAVILIFNRSPGSVLDGEGSCLVARSVIGPLVQLNPPFKLIDQTSQRVNRKNLGESTWNEALEASFGAWQELQRQGKIVQTGFTLCIRRRLVPELILELEVIFNE
jgi:hypothetical protein